MRKFLLPLIALLLCSGSFVSAYAQQTRLQAREAEWKNYALPKTNFTRKADADKKIVFRVPADWQQQGEELLFNGPHSASLKVLVQKVPEGYPLDDFFAATLQIVKDAAGGPDSIVTRKTQFQDVEAREMSFEVPDPEGEVLRSTSWLTIYGAQAVMFNLKVPASHVAEVEPFFKAVVQSVIFVSNEYAGFELLRELAFNTPAGPIDEIQTIVDSLGQITNQREAAITRLASLFSSQTDVALDLLVDRRSLIRLVAVEAAVQSNNSLLTPFLWTSLDDGEQLISEAAARGLGKSADIVPKLLDHSMSGFRTETIARVWPFMPRDKRNELLQILFKETAVRRDPPPAVKAPPAKPGVSAKVTELIAVSPGTPTDLTMPSVASRSPDVQMGALTLLSTMPPEEFKLPLARIVASNYDPLISVALQVALLRGETLPVEPLLKLVVSSNKDLRKFAARNLAVSATASDIRAIEALFSKDGSRKEVDDELKLAIKNINSRVSAGAVKTNEENRAVTLKRDLNIKPFGENLFPKEVVHYSGIPNPRQTVQNFYETLHGLQMDSPRAQSSLVLMLTKVRKILSQGLATPVDSGELIDYTGIDPDAPIALGSWNTASANRRAIMLRVKDRARFERVVDIFQRNVQGFTKLTDSVAVASRAIAALPAVVPFTAQAILSLGPSAPRNLSALRYSFAGDTEWNGLKLRVIETRSVDFDWTIQNEATYIAYFGDTAILTPDIATLRELLANANGAGDRELLADNAEFRQTIESRGDVVYFSDLRALFAEPGKTNEKAAAKLNERGALKFSASSWENSHHLAFDESDWSKPFLPFHPNDLTAARELLPSSTIAYLLTKIDLPRLWSISAKELRAPLEAVPAFWALDFKQEVLPELGPECGVVMTHLPDIAVYRQGAVAAFCKLKSNKLSEALIAGRLLRGVGPTSAIAEVKFGDDTFFVASRHGFLVVSTSTKGLAAFDGKTNLAGTRDYSRSVAKVPHDIVAFAGYNLEAAVAAASNGSMEGLRGQIANVLFAFTSAFHSQNFYATVTAGSVEAHSSVSMDREGRYSVADFSSLPQGSGITYAIVEPRGVPITDQRRLSSLVLKVHAKAPGPIDNIKDDIKSPEQIVEQKSPTELRLTVAARRAGAEKSVELPVKDPQFAPFLRATPEFGSDKQEVIDKAKEIAGNDRDAWSVARKLADWTNKNLEWKFVATADPVQTLATREADCSEFSALFVAMARSLGLPARMVSGLAYNGSSFGGHAWVEVWAGRWIELDPTWGTSFVDATHIRNSTNTLLTSAALNLIELEVLEAKRSAAEFQRSPRALTEHLVQVIPLGDKSEVEATVDLATLTDEYMGANAWSGLSDTEREQMWSAYRRVIIELLGYSKDEFGERRFHVVHLEEKGDRAEAILVTKPTELLLKLRFVRRNDVWHLLEVVQTDTSLATVSEMLRPTIAAIEKARAGEKAVRVSMSDFVRVLLVIDKDPAKANRLADELLKAKPKDKELRYLKGLALLNGETSEQAVKLLTELSGEGFAPAVYRLAQVLSDSDNEAEAKKAIELYERYTSLEPYDPRAYSALADAYESADQFAKADAAYRKVIELDPADLSNYRGLITMLLVNNLPGDVRALLAAGEKYPDEEKDFFGSVMLDLFDYQEPQAAAKLAASEPLRMKTSAGANLWLGRMFIEEKRYVEADRLLHTAAQLDKKSTDVQVALAMLYRKQSRWLAALKAADQAIALNSDNSDGYYQRACALARLRRTNEAIAALKKAVELNRFQALDMAEEADLKPLSSLPEFKKLLPEIPGKQP